MKRILTVGEYSGRVRDAFRRLGFYAMSCDLLPTDVPGPHYEGPCEDILGDGWDMMIAFPPCTYLCASGLHWNKRDPKRALLTEKALEFVDMLWSAPIQHIAIENPVGCINTRLPHMPRPQYIQPYEFGEDASKRTGLWLKDLTQLLADPAYFMPPRMVDGKPRWGNQTDSGQNNLPPSPDRWKKRSETYQGIADAMAEQWSPLLVS